LRESGGRIKGWGKLPNPGNRRNRVAEYTNVKRKSGEKNLGGRGQVGQGSTVKSETPAGFNPS